jgi:hypothetical protein
MANMVWLTRIALLEEMYTRICGENGLQILCPGYCPDWRVSKNLVGIWIERSDGLQWLLITYAHTYAIVIPKYWEEGCQVASHTMAAIIRRLRAKSAKQLLPRGGVAELRSKSEEHRADSFEVAML